MTTRPSVLAFAPGTWRDHPYGSTRYHLWGLAQRGWPVLYVEPPVAFRLRSEIVETACPAFRVLRPGGVPPFSVRHSGVPGLGGLWRTLTALRLAVAARRFLPAPEVLWLGAPWHAPILPQFPGAFSAVHIYDDLAASPQLSPDRRAALAGWEAELLRAADLTLCSSVPQLEARRPHAARVELLENAVEDSFLSADPVAHPLVDRLAALPSPRYLYGGIVDHRLDPELFLALARRVGREGGSLVFLGKEDANRDPAFEAVLKPHPGVHFFGEIPYRLWPSLYALGAVLLLGHRRNAFTLGMLPEKMAEYLTSGRPIVTVRLPEAERLAAAVPGIVQVVDDAESFAAVAAELASENNPALARERRRVAAERTWTRMAERLELLLDIALRTRQRNSH